MTFLMGLMLMTFILLFVFVVNVGMMVHARINLQNAADLAAYAGAATQARQLTQISYLNYEMRRQYKKLLFRLYVVGNMAQDSFPRNPGMTGPAVYKPGEGSTNNPALANINYGVPTTCVIDNPAANVCHLTIQPKIEIPTSAVPGMDAVTDALSQNLQQLELIREGQCKLRGITNKLLNYYWLFNTDPTLSTPDGLDSAQLSAINLIKALATGLGIVPRELILGYRMQSLASYINAARQTGITPAAVQGWQASGDPMLYERTIQAYQSAYLTLGNHLFSAGMTMDEMIPDSLVNLIPITQQIDTFAVDLVLLNGDCQSQLVLISTPNALTVGYSKDPKVLTYYAVRLTASPQLLFSPFGTLTMTAYAAAQPFGSRLGPAASSGVSFATVMSPDTSAGYSVGSKVGNNNIPNLLVSSGASDLTWNTRDVQSLMFQALTKLSQNGAFSQTLSAAGLEQAYSVAMAPNPWEAARYNIPNDMQSDSFVRNFGPTSLNDGTIASLGGFWAPVFTAANRATASAQILSDLTALFSSQVDGNLGASSASITSLIQNLTQGMKTYLGALDNGAGENGEGTHIVRLTNPFSVPAPQAPIALPVSNEAIIMTDPSVFRSSWCNGNDSNILHLGRTGYSAKIISMQSLTANKLPTDDQTVWSNTFGGDATYQADLKIVQH